MASDQLSAWLTNRALIDQLTDATLLSKQDEIISFFRGFRDVIALCLRHKNTLELRRCSVLLNAFKKEQTEKATQSKNVHGEQADSATMLTDVEPRPAAPFLDLYDTAISMIFTHLDQHEHCGLQRACRLMTISGRKKTSYRIKLDDHSHICFGHHLEMEHKLASILDKLQSRPWFFWIPLTTTTTRPSSLASWLCCFDCVYQLSLMEYFAKQLPTLATSSCRCSTDSLLFANRC